MQVNRTSLALLLAVAAIIFFVLLAAGAVFTANAALGIGLALLAAALVLA